MLFCLSGQESALHVDGVSRSPFVMRRLLLIVARRANSRCTEQSIYFESLCRQQSAFEASRKNRQYRPSDF